jgi:ribonuclease P/MRP protein subunit RPP1
MYEAVRPYPAGETTTARFAREAAAMGYDGLVVRRSPDADTGDDFPGSASGPSAGDVPSIDIVPALEIDTSDRDRLARLVREHRETTPLLIARTTSTAATRFVAERERIDAVRPTPDAVPDHATIGTAAAHGVRIAVDLGPVRRDDGGSRVRSLSALRTLVTDLRDREAPHVVTGSPDSHLALRAPRDLAALGTALDVPGDWLRDGLAEWGRIAARNLERAAPPAGEPGVRLATPESGSGTADSAGSAGSASSPDGDADEGAR